MKQMDPVMDCARSKNAFRTPHHHHHHQRKIVPPTPYEKKISFTKREQHTQHKISTSFTTIDTIADLHISRVYEMRVGEKEDEEDDPPLRGSEQAREGNSLAGAVLSEGAACNHIRRLNPLPVIA